MDTGSSDLWTNSATSELCQNGDTSTPTSDSGPGDISCSTSGTYDANSSSTYRYINSDFYIQYADTTGAAGDYVSDNLNMGGVTIENLQMGIGYDSNSTEGVMGIGYPNLEVQVQYNGEEPYPNIPQAMVDQNLINSPAYSLWLDDLASSTGNILFGGVDTDKYSGSLETLKIIKEGGEALEMIVELSNITISNGETNRTVTSERLPVRLDSGATLSYLPPDVAETIYSAVGAQFSDEYEVAFCRCSLADSPISMAFQFGAKSIIVDMNEMVLTGGLGDPDSDTGCVFGVVAQPAGQFSGTAFTLGDTFIRNAYIVYDLGNDEISLAQTNFESTSSNVREIGSGEDAVPDASGNAQDPSISITGTATGGGTLGPTAGSNAGQSASVAMAVPTAIPGRSVLAGVAGAGMMLAAAL